jgi:type II secretory pathway pseudopilin PulG
MFCYKCGAAMPEQSEVCPQCGAAVQAFPPPASSSTSPSAAPAPWLNVPPGAAYVAQQETDGKAIASLILGILAIFPFWLFAGIPAIILGHLSRATIGKSNGQKRGGGMAVAGLIMGYLSLGLTLIIFAIAIPNLRMARTAANESAAATTVRTLNTTQAIYSTNYPQVGYASSLAVLGPGVPPVNCRDAGTLDSNHSCLVDSLLGCSSATWCIKNGYKFHLKAICRSGVCDDYVITATPVEPRSGGRSFCSSGDAVVRVQTSRTRLEPLQTANECQAWPAI